jgi:hypothetical protein
MSVVFKVNACQAAYLRLDSGEGLTTFAATCRTGGACSSTIPSTEPSTRLEGQTV